MLIEYQKLQNGGGHSRSFEGVQARRILRDIVGVWAFDRDDLKEAFFRLRHGYTIEIAPTEESAAGVENVTVMRF